MKVYNNGTVDVDFNDYYVGGHLYSVDFIEPYTEPKEQTEAEEADTDSLVAGIDKVIEGHRKAFADITDSFDWQRYEADLAKDLAIAYGKRGKSPLDAVAAAKEITKRLKQK